MTSKTPSRALTFRNSDYGVALLLEDPERTSPHSDEVPLGVVHLRLCCRRPAGAVDDLALAGYAPLADGPEEVDVHLYSGRPHADQREHGEAHGGIYERSVDPAVQRPGPVEVEVLDVNVDGAPARLDVLYLRPDVLREGDPLVDSLQTSNSSLRAPLTSKVPFGNPTILSLNIL